MAEALAPRDDDKGSNPFLLFLIGGAALLVVGVLPRLSINTNPMVGKPAPGFTLEVVHNGEKGSRLDLASLQGHPVVLDFWATWCGPCKMEAPILSRIAERYKDRGLIVVGVNTSDRAGLAGPYADKENLAYPVVFDQGDIGQKYGVESLPTLVIIGKDGTVRALRSGVVDESTLDSLVTSELLVNYRIHVTTRTRPRFL